MTNTNDGKPLTPLQQKKLAAKLALEAKAQNDGKKPAAAAVAPSKPEPETVDRSAEKDGGKVVMLRRPPVAAESEEAPAAGPESAEPIGTDAPAAPAAAVAAPAAAVDSKGLDALKTKVTELETLVNALRGKVATLEAQNDGLANELREARQQADNAMQKAEDADSAVNDAFDTMASAVELDAQYGGLLRSGVDNTLTGNALRIGDFTQAVEKLGPEKVWESLGRIAGDPDPNPELMPEEAKAVVNGEGELAQTFKSAVALYVARRADGDGFQNAVNSAVQALGTGAAVFDELQKLAQSDDADVAQMARAAIDMI